MYNSVVFIMFIEFCNSMLKDVTYSITLAFVRHRISYILGVKRYIVVVSVTNFENIGRREILASFWWNGDIDFSFEPVERLVILVAFEGMNLERFLGRK